MILHEERDNLKYLGMLRQKPKYITVEYRHGYYILDPDKAFKSMWCGDKCIWRNPEYEKGGKYYEDL